jgi:hypothetical protein
MRTPSLVVTLLALALVGCRSEKRGEDHGAARSVRSESSGLPRGVSPSAEVLRMRRIAGVWRSAPGALSQAPGQVVQVETAFDRSFQMTLWGRDPKDGAGAVFARQSGRFGLVGDDVAASASGAVRGVLASLATWRGRLRADGAMTLSPSTGAPLLLRRTAN